MPPLPLVLAIHIHDVAAATIGLVGLVALGLAAVGFRAAAASPALRFVAVAFLVFAAKGLFSAWAIWTRVVPHEHLELVLGLGDLAVVTLLVIPLFTKPGRRAP